MKNRYEIKFYWTLHEVVNKSAWDTAYNELYNLLHPLFPNAPIYNGTSMKQYMEDLFRLVYARYENHYCIATINETLSDDSKKLFLGKLITILVNTYDRYAPLLKYYKENENKLMDGIKAKTNGIVGFNDTPQNGGEFADDNHRTNVTETETTNEIDGATVAERLNEIRLKYRNILYDWSNEFDKIFIEEGNI